MNIQEIKMKKTIIRSADYEFYRILLPWKSIFSQHRKFIIGELEKRHPRFSGSCCYDAKYCVEKKNLMAEIVVMEKSSLAQYKNAGGNLYIEDNTKRSVFNQRTRIVRGVSLILIMLTGILSFRIAKSLISGEKLSAESQVAEKAISPADALLAEGGSSSDEQFTLESPEILLPKVFASISAHGGKISAFSYSRKDSSDGRKSSGLSTFSIHGCNCEEVTNAQYCVVSFKNNEPHFEMILPFQKDLLPKTCLSPDEEKSASRTLSHENDAKTIASIRSQLRELGAVIESERNGEDCVDFAFFSDFSILYSCLKICGLEAESSLWSVKSLSLTESGNRGSVRISFDKGGEKEDFSPLLLASRYAYLFGPELKILPKKAGLISEKRDSLKNLAAKSKVGEIKKNDGSIFVCYRNSEGRMAFLKQERANENR